MNIKFDKKINFDEKINANYLNKGTPIKQ